MIARRFQRRVSRTIGNLRPVGTPEIANDLWRRDGDPRRGGSTVPPGRNEMMAAYPALKRRAIIRRPPDAGSEGSNGPMQQSIFTPLEQAVPDAICRAHPTDRTALEAQLSSATFLSRENTGCGFFTHFTVDHDSSAPIGGERLRDGPAAKVDGIKYGMGFILWLVQGYADCLEGYAYGPDSTTDTMFETVSFEITQPPNEVHLTPDRKLHQRP